MTTFFQRFKSDLRWALWPTADQVNDHITDHSGRACIPHPPTMSFFLLSLVFIGGFFALAFPPSSFNALAGVAVRTVLPSQLHRSHHYPQHTGSPDERYETVKGFGALLLYVLLPCIVVDILQYMFPKTTDRVDFYINNVISSIKIVAFWLFILALAFAVILRLTFNPPPHYFLARAFESAGFPMDDWTMLD